ncbi:hypothetical protein WJX72_001735 [[Myrmecia] bisecta]|uniref:Uncharacterized protein n=1 Tax=[Myrmecia] bisecta TaxID=41462 RepID=A0AAW1PJE6_9CHLO
MLVQLLFEKALELPGTGLKRYRDKPNLISDGEKMAALYNIACCHSRLGNMRTGLVALAGCLELGYTDGAQLRSDPDLEFLRTDEKFEGLLARFDQKSRSGFLGNFLKNFT